MSDHAMLEVEGLVRRFGDRAAVDGVSLRLERGSVLGFLGLNGAGKTTTIRMLCGLLAPHEGSIRVDGIDLLADPRAAIPRVGYVPDRCRVHPWMTVGQAMRFCRRLRPDWDDDLADRMLDVFRLEPRKKVKALSKGMAAKLALLLAIASRPPVLILDEPLSGLDPVVHDEFLDGVLRQVIDRGQTVLFSTHDLPDVRRLADSIVILHEGRVRESGSLDTILERGRRVRAVLAGDQAVPPADAPDGTIAQRLDRRTWELIVRDWRAEEGERLAASPAIVDLDVEPVTLVDLFKAHVSGRDGDLSLAPSALERESEVAA